MSYSINKQQQQQSGGLTYFSHHKSMMQGKYFINSSLTRVGSWRSPAWVSLLLAPAIDQVQTLLYSVVELYVATGGLWSRSQLLESVQNT